jgi:hypothetical protein
MSAAPPAWAGDCALRTIGAAVGSSSMAGMLLLEPWGGIEPRRRGDGGVAVGRSRAAVAAENRPVEHRVFTRSDLAGLAGVGLRSSILWTRRVCRVTLCGGGEEEQKLMRRTRNLESGEVRGPGAEAVGFRPSRDAANLAYIGMSVCTAMPSRHHHV